MLAMIPCVPMENPPSCRLRAVPSGQAERRWLSNHGRRSPEQQAGMESRPAPCPTIQGLQRWSPCVAFFWSLGILGPAGGAFSHWQKPSSPRRVPVNLVFLRVPPVSFVCHVLVDLCVDLCFSCRVFAVSSGWSGRGQKDEIRTSWSQHQQMSSGRSSADDPLNVVFPDLTVLFVRGRILGVWDPRKRLPQFFTSMIGVFAWEGANAHASLFGRHPSLINTPLSSTNFND